ncbi:hypothetical protein [Mycolicibacterium sp. 624]|uniref:hypothetical protein n=1 Tax=Mycolicibacterium sp. 624 TaxID=3156314 RepID=UPI003397B4E7
MTASARLPALIVLLAPRASTEEILAVLADYSAAGMLTAFAWIDANEVGRSSVPTTLVRDGTSEVVSLQRLLTGKRYGRVRLAVLVPVQAHAMDRVPLAAEQAVERVVRSASVGAEVTLLRLLLTGSADAGSAYEDQPLVLEGWHNLLIVPEDAPSPELGSVIIDPLDDPFELARHVAPVICGTAGMWTGIEATPFDTVEIVPGQTVRAVRGFYRELDSAEVEDQLRAQLFGGAGQLPLPNGGPVPVVYIDDAELAARKMARALWTKRRDVLRGPRIPLESPAPQTISIWEALKMFLRFLGMALRRAPSAWMSSMLGSVSSAVAATVQSTMFGRTGSAFAVVADTQVAGWEQLGSSAEAMSTELLGGVEDGHRARRDLSSLWTDFINGALTLADGGRRDAGLEPVSVGAGVGVVRRSADVVPGASERFSAIPASLAAVIGMDSVEPVDVLAATDLRDRLERAYADQAAGVEARHAAAELERWQEVVSKSYAWQTAAILADFMGRARAEVTTLVEQIRAASITQSIDERLRRRQQAIALALKTFGWALFVALGVMAIAAAVGWLSWSFTLTCGGALMATYVLVALAMFVVAQRDMFAEMNSRKSALSQLEAMQTNVRSALDDLSRLSMAYGQLLSWCRASGAFLRAPFGAVVPATGARTMLIQGLPRSTQVAVAAHGDDHGDTTHRIQQRLYRLGWLTRPWEQLLAAVAADVRTGQADVLAMPGAGSGSALDHWSRALAKGQVAPSGAEVLWRRVQQLFDDPAVGIGEGLVDTVVQADGARVSAAEFGDGMIERHTGRGAPFDASLFTHAAQTASSSAVAIDEGMVLRRGLGYRAAVIQASEGLPSYDFAVFAPPQTMSSVDNESPPGSGDLVF